MDISLLKHLGNLDQIAGIREVTLQGGRGSGMRLAEFYNAAGLRFSVMPDRGMDLLDLSYKGINLSFQTKNGAVSPFAFSPKNGEFTAQWSGGALVTCGLDHVGGHSETGETFPTHGRISYTPAKTFGVKTFWDESTYRLRAEGDIHQTRMYGRHLGLNRTVETELYGKSIVIRDVITNYEGTEEPFMLLYHCNFGYPLLQADSQFAFSDADILPLNDRSKDPTTMTAPIDGQSEELYFFRTKEERAYGVLYNRKLGLGVYVAFDTRHLPHFLQWKLMKSHDYVLAIEPCNTLGLSREETAARGAMPTLAPYSSIEIALEIGVLDGEDEINAFLKTHHAKETV